MAKRAILAQGGGEKAHCVHELLHGNAAEDLDILEILLGHERLLRRFRLAARSGRREHTGHSDSHRAHNRSPQSERQAWPPSLSAAKPCLKLRWLKIPRTCREEW